MREALYSKLTYLASQQISSIELDVEIQEPASLESFKNRLQNNKSYKIKLALSDEKSALVKVEKLQSRPDPFVSVGYYYREVNPDYASVTLGAAIPIYGTESLNEERVRKELLESTHLSQDYYEKLKAELTENYAQLTDNYNSYLIITKESIPEIEHMFDLTSSMLENGKNLLIYTNLLEKRLNLHEQKVSLMASQKRALTNIEALLGEI